MVTDRDIHICKPRAFAEWIGKMELLCKNDWINDEHAIYRFGSHNKHFLAMNKNKTTHKRTTHIQEATKQCVLYFCYWKLAINVVRREKEKKKQHKTSTLIAIQIWLFTRLKQTASLKWCIHPHWKLCECALSLFRSWIRWFH